MKKFHQLSLGQVRRQLRQLEDGESRGEERGEEGAGVLVVQPCHHLGQDGVGHGGGEQGGRHLQPADPGLLTFEQIASSSFNVASLYEQSNQALSGQDEERFRLNPGRHFGFRFSLHLDSWGGSCVEQILAHFEVLTCPGKTCICILTL